MLQLNTERNNNKFLTAGNNNSLSSLKLNDKKLCIDLGNKNNQTESYYSPLARGRSGTVPTNESMFNKCKSSKSISSSGQNSATLLHQTNKVPNTPYRNIKLSAKKYEHPMTAKAPAVAPPATFQEQCENVEKAGAVTNKNVLKYRGMYSVKNHIDVQKVREAILGSIDTANSEYQAHEKRKLNFLNSLDESKDYDLVRKKFR